MNERDQAPNWEAPVVKVPISDSLAQYVDEDPRPFWYYRNCPKIDQAEGRCRMRSTRVVRHQACSEMCTKCVWMTQRDFSNESVFDIHRSFSEKAKKVGLSAGYDRDVLDSPDGKATAIIDVHGTNGNELKGESQDSDDEEDEALEEKFISAKSSQSTTSLSIKSEFYSCESLPQIDLSELPRGLYNGSVATADSIPQLEVIETGILVNPPKRKFISLFRLDYFFGAQKKRSQRRSRHCRKLRDFASEIQTVAEDNDDEDIRTTPKKSKLCRLQSLKRIFCCF